MRTKQYISCSLTEVRHCFMVSEGRAPLVGQVFFSRMSVLLLQFAIFNI